MKTDLKINDENNKLLGIIEESDKEQKNITETNFDDNKEFIDKKIIKPKDLQNFDTPSHLQKNIASYYMNCKDNITQKSYYCITCQQSICEICGIDKHAEHVLIQRDNCLFFDPNFFREISKIIEISLKIDIKKQEIKNSIEKNISSIKSYLDEIKIAKYKEIDEYFENINKNVILLKNRFDETKNKIENYYNRYNKFFNIKYINEKINIVDYSINNLDIENTIFLINFDLMNLCDNKNLQVLENLNEITNKINSLNKMISLNKDELIKKINSIFELGLKKVQFENFYEEVIIRLEKFSEFINQFKDTVADIFQKTANFDRIKELLDLFDSKNKKNKDIIFQQKFFMDNKTENDNMTKEMPISSNITKNFKNNDFISNSNEKRNITYRNSLKVKINYSNKNSDNKKSKSFRKIKIEKNLNSSSKKHVNNKFHIFNNYFSENPLNNSQNEKISNKVLLSSKFTSEDVTLNNRILQRFFSYSIYEFYIQNFKSDINKIDNIKIDEPSPKQNLEEENNLKIKDYNSSNKKHNITNFIIKEEINNVQELKDKNKYNLKSLSYLSNYQNRLNALKEIAKPIVGTNQIYIFDQTSKKIIKKAMPLNKDKHGYSLFPDGCRHMLINNTLFITGGNNKCGYIILSYDILSHKITRLSNFISEHSFHTLEYIENFDCIICIGGENSSNCEIMDISQKKWKKLPQLNYQRANCNVYYNNLTEQIFVLFGMKGNLWEKNNKNIDKIEMLELNNIEKGWKIIDYYKSCGIDLKFNFCKIIPFTKDKLIIFGGNNMRGSESQNFYVIFDMNKYEIFQVDKQTLEMVKIEEKKMRLADLALAKIN